MSEDMKKDLMEDPEDEMLKAVMGSKFQDQTTGGPEGPGKQTKVTGKEFPKNLGTLADKPDIRPNVAAMGNWSGKTGFFEKLRECGKWALIFGGVCLVVFYWQQTGQMMPSAAVPSMMACTFGAAWCVGRACK
jgi:hypothetical protein